MHHDLIVLQTHIGEGLVALGVAAAVQAEAHAVGLVAFHTAGHAPALPAIEPAELLRRHVKALVVVDDRVAVLVAGTPVVLVARLAEVLLIEGNRIHVDLAQSTGQQMQRAGFQFLAAEAAGDTHGDLVGDDHLGLDVPVGALVQGNVQLAQTLGHLALGQLGARAGTNQPVALQGLDAAVLGDADLADELVVQTAFVEQQVLFLGQGVLDGNAGHLGQGHGEHGDVAQGVLVAVAAAHVGGSHVDVRADGVGQRAADHVGALRRSPHAHMGVVIPAGGHKGALRCAGEGPGIGNLALHDHVALGKALFHVAVLDLVERRIVALEPAARRQAVALIVIALGLDVVLGPVNFRRAGLDGVLHVVDGRQLPVFHMDQFQRLLGDLGILRGHGGHRIAHETQMLAHDRAVRGHAGLPVGSVLIGHDAAHAGQLLGLGGVDGHDLRMGIGAVQHLGNIAVLDGQVIAIQGLARDDGAAVLTAAYLADMTEFAHACSPPFTID